MEQFYLMEQILTLWVRVDLGIMTTKAYSTFSKFQDWSLAFRCSEISYSIWPVNGVIFTASHHNEIDTISAIKHY